MSISDLQAQIDNLTLRVRVLELEVRRTAEAAPAVPLASSSAPEVQAAEALEESTVNHGSLTWEERLVVARLTGDFFVRCLEGTNRGGSGQNRIGLPKRVYVLIRDNKDNVFRGPVRVYTRFSDIKPFVQVGSGFGNAIFAGFASQREAREAVEHAGFEWPSSTSS